LPASAVRPHDQGSFPRRLGVRGGLLLSHRMAMDQRLILHIVDGDSRSRAEQARTAFALGHHAEVYSDLSELWERPPFSGILLLSQKAMDVPLPALFERLGEKGAWLPVIVCAEEPQIDDIVNAIKGGALDYLELPLETGRLERSLTGVSAEAEEQGWARRRAADARRRVSQLSKREREVLELLAQGSSNKVIARELSISPRTVEIHRGNMMTKLRAIHSAEAVRLWLQSGLEAQVPDPQRELEMAVAQGLAHYPELVRLIREQIPEDLDEPAEASGEKPARNPAKARSRGAGSR
jgi:FixJ family two-component response regulator